MDLSDNTEQIIYHTHDGSEAEQHRQESIYPNCVFHTGKNPSFIRTTSHFFSYSEPKKAADQPQTLNSCHVTAGHDFLVLLRRAESSVWMKYFNFTASGRPDNSCITFIFYGK